MISLYYKLSLKSKANSIKAYEVEEMVIIMSVK